MRSHTTQLIVRAPILILAACAFLVLGHTEPKSFNSIPIASLPSTLRPISVYLESPKSLGKVKYSGPVSEEEYAVYSAVLNAIKTSPSDGKGAKPLVINDRTRGPFKGELEDVARCEKALLANDLRPLLDDMIAKNAKEYPLDRRFKLNRNYALLSLKGFSDFFKAKGASGWGDYYKKYSHASGFNTFSRVGFSADGTRAVLLNEVSCGANCAYFKFVLLRKQTGKWGISAEHSCADLERYR